MTHYIIGAGGGGSWLAPALCRLVGPKNITIVDGDRFEKKNLDRQLFSSKQIGDLKANALSYLYGCVPDNRWYFNGMVSHSSKDWIFGCVDNHPARVSILDACDAYKCKCILCGNEIFSSEAMVYFPRWKGTNLDPRVYYPEITKDKSGDPRAAAVGCAGDAQIKTPQLVSANLMAVSLGLHLYVVWAIQSRKLERSVLSSLPHRLMNNLSRCESFPAQINEPEKKG